MAVELTKAELTFTVDLEGELDSDLHFEADNTAEEIKDSIEFVIQTCPVHDIIVNTPDFETEIVTNEF